MGPRAGLDAAEKRKANDDEWGLVVRETNVYRGSQRQAVTSERVKKALASL
jgi:hypothetical protein